MATTALKAKFLAGKKLFEVQMCNGQTVSMTSSGLFDTERELLKWALSNGGNALGYLDGSQRHQYLLVYGGELYDVEVDT